MTTDDGEPTESTPDDQMPADLFDDVPPDDGSIDESSETDDSGIGPDSGIEPDSGVSPGGGSGSCHRCGDPIVEGEPFCSNCGFAFGLVDGKATAARRSTRRGNGFLVMLPLMLGIVAIGVLLFFYLTGRDDEPAVTTTVATVTTSASGQIGLPTGDSYGEYVEVSDDTGRLTLRIPAAWSDVSGAVWTDGDLELGPRVSASIDRQAWASSWGVPGIFIGVDEVRGRTVAETLDLASFSDECVLDSREPYDDGVYTGEMEIYSACGGSGSQFVQIAAAPEGGGFVAFLQVVMVTEADSEALSEIISSWIVG